MNQLCGVADENMKTRKKAGAFWAVSSVGGTFWAVSSIDGAFWAVSSIDGTSLAVSSILTVLSWRYES